MTLNNDTLDQHYLKSLTLLYVEDEEDVLEQAIQFFSRFCGTLLTARNGAEGLEIFRAHHPDIIITDILMPVMDGLTMAAEIRQLDLKVPIVMLTAFEQANYLMRSIEIGIDKYVTKPISVSQLLNSLLDCAHRLRVERQLQESEERFRQMFEDSPDALMLLHDGFYFDCNRAAEKMLRCERQQICGQKPEYFYPLVQTDGRLSSDVAAENTAEALKTGKASYEWLQQRPDGTLFLADISLSVITMQGRQVLFSSWRDVSMRRQLEEKLQKLIHTD